MLRMLRSSGFKGDVAVYRRSAVIRVPGTDEPVYMTIRPGEATTAGRGEHAYHIQVAEVKFWHTATALQIGQCDLNIIVFEYRQ